MARRNFSRSTFDSINLTPLIDTLFFLLIIFMVTAPLLEYSMDVSPPAMNADEIDPRDMKNAKTINIKADGTIIFDQTAVSQDELIRQLYRYINDPDVKVYLRADSEVKYGSVIQVLQQVKNSGFSNIFLITAEESSK